MTRWLDVTAVWGRRRTEEAAVVELRVAAVVLELDGVEDGVGGEEARRPHHVQQLVEAHQGQAEGADDEGDGGRRRLVVTHPPLHRLKDLNLGGTQRVPRDHLAQRALQPAADAQHRATPLQLCEVTSWNILNDNTGQRRYSPVKWPTGIY